MQYFLLIFIKRADNAGGHNNVHSPWVTSVITILHDLNITCMLFCQTYSTLNTIVWWAKQMTLLFCKI